jgi:hypothetical protein
MSSPYISSVFDNGWASQYELEDARRLEVAKAGARARHESNLAFERLAREAVAGGGSAPELEAPHAYAAGGAAVVPAACSPQCSAGGCQFDRAAQMLAKAQQALEATKRLMRVDQTGGRTLSAAMWCDIGQHAYSANDPKAEMWTKKVRDDEGRWVERMLDVCGQCVATGGSPDFNGAERAAIMAGGDPHPAPDYIASPRRTGTVEYGADK